ncbi:hypothetical protein [Polycyclovorans algicola]|uniref:hypothetical protein n=1 Tax=Polycyclovorans algicola TaxID=616992 RepID=UPI00126820C3|nr:hypothetical protein [Polycyclovorans algicola]
MRYVKICCYAVFTALLSGCAAFIAPSDYPVIEDKLNRSFIDDEGAVSTLSVTPERRVIIANHQTKRFCAEAPTEVGLDVSKLASLAAKLEKPGELSAALSAVLASSRQNSVLNKRTQGLQLFLATSYFVCQMYMNEAITNEQLLEIQLKAINAVGPLIDKEIPYLYEQQKELSATSASVFKPLDIPAALQSIGTLPTESKTGKEGTSDAEAPKSKPSLSGRKVSTLESDVPRIEL